MFKDFYAQRGEYVVISAEQASHFAKGVAGDYNPIHNPDARRFCVPGDLLFALVLAKFGLSRHMTFRFTSSSSCERFFTLPETIVMLLRHIRRFMLYPWSSHSESTH